MAVAANTASSDHYMICVLLSKAEVLPELRRQIYNHLHSGIVLASGHVHDVQGVAPQNRMIGDLVEALRTERIYEVDNVLERIANAGVER
tara:strand:+ start:1114 stop:1383 length:270 start_codon:yes stop_codon:yes gene_type:complete